MRNPKKLHDNIYGMFNTIGCGTAKDIRSEMFFIGCEFTDNYECKGREWIDIVCGTNGFISPQYWWDGEVMQYSGEQK